MTTFTANAYQITSSTRTARAEVTFTFAEGEIPNLRYSNAPGSTSSLPEVNFSDLNIHSFTGRSTTGFGRRDVDLSDDRFTFGEVVWGANSEFRTLILGTNNNETQFSQYPIFLIELAGDALPASIIGFAGALLGPPTATFGPATTPSFRPGQSIEFSSLDLLSVTENDVLNGTTSNDIISAGAGDDEIIGLEGDDRLSGGAGNDFIIGGNVVGESGNDTLFGGAGDDTLVDDIGNNIIDGGSGDDRFISTQSYSNFVITQSNGVFSLSRGGETTTIENVETFQFSDRELTADELIPRQILTGTDAADTFTGANGNDRFTGNAGDDVLSGETGSDVLLGGDGNDSLYGGDGADTLNGGEGDDFIFGGDSSADLRDLVFAGAGNDSVDGGYGNDEIFGQGGNDTIAGGFGSDTLQGQDGNDVITGSALSDLVFGNAGDDFVNGGFGHDRINGGSGADRFFHLGIRDHGSDFIQDYNAAEGDVLLSGIENATRDDFQVNFNDAVAPGGEAAGDDNVQEAFVIYRPTGQILWALIDGAGQSSINLQIGSDTFDLLA